ncbi:MAG: hypothetical protein DYG85_05040, partial [Chloroflexi bacterium CFX1]|nr:hypothetical protein [Chloroflexi bacterium CFX1]
MNVVTGMVMIMNVTHALPIPATGVAIKGIADLANTGQAVAIIIARAGRSRRGVTGSAKDRRMSAVLLLRMLTGAVAQNG